MLSVEKVSENRVDLRLEGPIDADAMSAGLDALLDASADVEDGVMLYVIDEFQWPTAGALVVEFWRLPKLFTLVGKFRRCAVLCDAAWLRTIAEFEGALIPGLEINAYTPDQRDVAEAWLAEAPSAP